MVGASVAAEALDSVVGVPSIRVGSSALTVASEGVVATTVVGRSADWATGAAGAAGAAGAGEAGSVTAGASSGGAGRSPSTGTPTWATGPVSRVAPGTARPGSARTDDASSRPRWRVETSMATTVPNAMVREPSVMAVQ